MNQDSFKMLIDDLFKTEVTLIEDPDDATQTIYGYS